MQHKETQKKAVGGSLVSYPVKQIEILSENTFLITCRNKQCASDFDKITSTYPKVFRLESTAYDYELTRSDLAFTLAGPDSLTLLSKFAYTGLLSNSLLNSVRSALSLPNQQLEFR